MDFKWSYPTLTWGVQTIEYPRIVFWREPEFTFEISLLQIGPGQLMYFSHVYIHHFSPSTLRLIKERWESERPRMPPILFAQGDVTDQKWIKYVSIFGFQPLIDDALCTDGQKRHIYVHFRK